MLMTEFLPHVLPSVPGCPELLALDHVIKAARKFCASTLIWNLTLPPIVAQKGETEYTLQLAPGQELVRLMYVEVDGQEYDVPSGPQGRRYARRSNGQVVTMVGSQDFTLTPAPGATGAVILTDAAIKPTLDATTFPDDFAEYLSDIAAGAISTLCLLPDNAWTNEKLAGIEDGIFRQRINVVSIKITQGFGRGRRRYFNARML